MSSSADLRALMEEIRSAMRDHREVWDRVFARQGTKRRRDNTEAYAAARPYWDRMVKAWMALESRLPEWSPTLDARTIDAWLTVCEIDIPAFRVGYMKEGIYRGLKKATLTSAQQQRLMSLALHHLKAPQWRRELRELTRLVLPIADGAFLAEIEALWHQCGSGLDRYKVGLFLETLLQRKDLEGMSSMSRRDITIALEDLRRAYQVIRRRN